MARERTQFKQTTYLSVNAQGELYSTSKEPREGFELVELEDGNKFYKKVFEGTDFGFITGLGIIEKSFQKGKAKYLQFTVENEEAKDIVDKCNYSLVISDFMATELNYSDRIYLFNKFLKTILQILPVKAIHWSYSQKIVEPKDYKSALDYESLYSLYSLYGIINVRYFIVDNFYVMDTIGLSALGLPDLQCKFKNIDTGIIATILYDLAYKIFEKGDYIEDTEIMEIFKIKFKCVHELSKTKPQRIVLNLIII
jgi:hypothetical protein